MALKELTPEQIHSMTLEEKDRWWLENVWRGDMPQLTLRSACTGFILGGALSLTNIYIGIKAGWQLGVGITSVILSFVAWKLLSKFKIGKEMTLLENNAMQSIATMAGYMNTPMVASLVAYMMVTQKVIPWWQMMSWMVVISSLGILYAFPLKKRFINDEQYEFPEGRACGVVLDGLHNPDESPGHSKTHLLLGFGIFGVLWNLMRSEKIMGILKIPFSIPEYFDDLIYKFAAIPSILGTSLKTLTVRWETDIAITASGGLMSMTAATSMLIGAVLNFCILAPMLIQKGIILPNAKGIIGFREIAMWSLWGGVAMMTSSSLFSFFSKPKIILQAFSSVFGKVIKRKNIKEDILKDIELPMKVFVIGIPVMGFLAIVLTHYYFGLDWWLGIIAIPLTFAFTIIAAHSTALTSITPTGPLGKLTQLTYSVLAPGNITTNIATAAINSEVSASASQLLMDIKPGYMLGAKPRQQAMGHLIGIFAGSLFGVPVFYWMFHGDISLFGSEIMPMPAAIQWKAVADVLTKGLGFLDSTALWAIIIGAVLGIVFEIMKKTTKGRFSLSAVGFGLAFVLPFFNSLSMFLGCFIFWLADKLARNEKGWVKRVMIPAQETICAGVIAGGALIGIVAMIVELNY